MSLHCSGTVLGLCLIFELGAGRALAVAPEIKDEARFFSPEAVKKANDEIRDIERRFERDLLIESYSTVPDNQAARVKAMSREDREKFFQEWARKRASEAVVNGVYILICKEPGHVQVEVSSRARSVFGSDVRDMLVRILVSKFREKHFDEGLADAVRFVRERLAAAK